MARSGPTSPYGPQVDGESELKRRCRLHQSWYRVERLHVGAFGLHQADGRPVGSALVAGEQTGHNFITPTAWAYAREKLEEKRTVNPDLTIDKYRLFNNMLSSQPMCFNLFSDLRAGIVRLDPAATNITLFRDTSITAVDAVEVEHLPQPLAEYIKDKTAFDASIRFRNAAGSPGIVTVETKYTDTLGSGSARAVKDQIELLASWGVCTVAGLIHFREHGISQVARNLLLTIAYQRRHGLFHAVNYVVGLRDDRSVRRDVEGLQAKLVEPFRQQIQVLPLEDLVARARALAAAPYTAVFETFDERYLALERVEDGHFKRSLRTR